MKKIVLVAGARPNFIKIAPLVEALKKFPQEFQTFLVHTGQHYDKAMSQDFFLQLGIPEPNINLESGGGTQAEQTASIMMRFEKYLNDNPCDLVVVVGDVTSTLACSIVAKKMNLKVAHVEGGIRSRDWSMPEEINRIVTDSISDFFFTTSITAGAHLQAEGKSMEQIHFVGNTMIDTLLKNEARFRAPAFWKEKTLQPGRYFVMTLHRPSNVDDTRQLNAILTAVERGAAGLPVVFPVHPRTRRSLDSAGIKDQYQSLVMVEPQGYLEFNYLVKNSIGVITDSGGITEETTTLGIPCITLRDSTERPETCTIGTNELIGTDPTNIEQSTRKMTEGRWKKGAIPPLWDGHAADRIVSVLRRILQ